MKPFQGAVIIIFVLLALFAVFIFATISTNRTTSIGNIVLWGTLPEDMMETLIRDYGRENPDVKGLSYVEFPEESISASLVEAIASNRGPDLVLLPTREALSESDKLIPISYNSISRRTFQDSFIEASEVLLTEEGLIGVPFYIDPLVLFWNRSLFSVAGIPRAPRYWDEITDIAPRLSRSNQSGTLEQSAVALGEWQNVGSAKEVLLSLIVGLGNPVIAINARGEYEATFSNRDNLPTAPAESAVRFFTDFADPVKTVYSWNRSQPHSRDAFLSGTLAIYFGRASEVISIRAGNPNLNFDISAFPEVRGGIPAVPAHLYALVVPRGSQNPQGALQVANILSGPGMQRMLTEATGLPSVRRDTLSVSPENPYETVFRDGALNAFVFLDPSPAQTDAIFQRVVESVSSGRLRISEAIRSGQEELQALLKVQ